MKKLKILGCMLSLLFFVLAATACQQSGAAGVESLRGTIVKIDSSGEFVLTASGKSYVVEGQQDLTALLGKFVKVSGTVTEKDGKSIIVASSVTE